MSVSITLSSLGWSKPDASPLFSDLNLTFGPERSGLVGRNGCGKSTLLHLIAGDLTPTTGRVQTSGRVAMMRQELMSDKAGETIADLFGVTQAIALLTRAEAGYATSDALAEADWTLPARIEAALLRLGLSVPIEAPLDRLSGGQRARAALAALVFAAPDFLLLDEPTNNLDRAGRDAVIRLLKGWGGGAVVVSHDREVLEDMDAIVELTSLGTTRYGGNYTVFRAEKAAALAVAAHALSDAEKARRDAAHRAQEASTRKARKDKAGRAARAKGDQPKILMDAAKGRAEASGGAGLRLREARREAAETALATARDRIEILTPIAMDIPPTGLAPGRRVLEVTGVTGGHDPDAPLIRDLSFTLTGPARLLIAGPNGSGKTTLLKLITGALTPTAGSITRVVPFALLDQHLDQLDPALSLRETFARLNPGTDPQTAHAALARFGFRAQDALRLSGSLSGGERLRAGLAMALGAVPVPMLLILDEPTNHLDLEGITALEAAIAAYDGAILAISHDADFVSALAPDRVIQLGAAKPSA